MAAERSPNSGLPAGNESWGLIGYLAVAFSLMLFWLIAVSFDRAEPSAGSLEPIAKIAAPIVSQISGLQNSGSPPFHPMIGAWSMLVADLCSDADLLSLKIRVDCETGSLVIQEEMLFESDGSTLHQAGRKLLRDAIPIYLEKLRSDPVIWKVVDRIEVRGHADFYATRAPYQTNLIASQRRAFGVASFLTSDVRLEESDREDFRRLSVVSGASFSRPPSNCPERSTECRPHWRRVEIRVDLDPARLRADVLSPRTPA